MVVNNDCNDSPKSQLCVPSDSIEDLEWFPNFLDDFISLNDVGLTLEHESYGFERASVIKPNQLFDESLFQTEFPVTPEQHDEKATKPKQDVTGFTRKRVRTKNQKRKKCEVTWLKKKCSHCETEETPQWRNGPLGPKTLCNACGVRFKAGRLVPEYRPASSPTFDSSRHSNYHKKIVKRRASD